MFYDNPELWLHASYQDGASLPSHLVMYDTLLEVSVMHGLLQQFIDWIWC